MEKPIVVLASGDPLFYGIGTFLSRHFQPPEIRYLPAPSSMALAFARAGISWEDARLMSLHGRPMGDVAAALDRWGKVGLFTDDKNTPAAVGALLGDREGKAWICERLGLPEENVRGLPISELANASADPLNVLILVGPKRLRPTIPYLSDDDFEKKMPRKGLITKREVRVLSLAALGTCPGDVAWDIGAGCGSVAIEMARLGAAKVFAIEKNADGCAIIRDNVARLQTPQVAVIEARAPEGLAELPDPDRVFLGGTGGNMGDLIVLVLGRLKPGGALVANVATVENLAQCLDALKRSGARWEVSQIQVSRGSPILDLTRFDANNPVWIVSARLQESA